MAETQVGEEVRERQIISRLLMLEWAPVEEGRAPRGWRRGSWPLCDDGLQTVARLVFSFSVIRLLSVLSIRLFLSRPRFPLQNATPSSLMLCDP